MPTPAPSTTSVTADGAVTEGEQSRRHLRPGHILRERIRDTVAAEARGSRTVADLAPALLARTGVGPVRAAQAIVSRSHHGRCRSEAAFAALAGASPVPASSGRVARDRLNRGGE